MLPSQMFLKKKKRYHLKHLKKKKKKKNQINFKHRNKQLYIGTNTQPKYIKTHL